MRKDCFCKLLTGFIMVLFTLAIIPPGYTGESDSKENDTSEVIELDKVVVTATRTEEDVLDVPQHVTVITSDELSQIKGKDIAGILKTEAGITLTDYGPGGSLKALSLRGSTSAQVLILINGVRASGSHGGDISLIPLENIECIEIVRGGMSALYGADAVGGVINIITKKKGENRIRVTVENVSYIPQSVLKGSGSEEYEAGPDPMALIDTQKAHVDFSYTINNLAFNTSVNGIHANNEYVYPDPASQMRVRENADLSGGDALCDIFYSLPEGYMHLSGIGIYHEQGSPGNMTYLTPEAHQVQTAMGTTFQYKTNKLFTDILTLDFKAYYNYFKLDYTDPQILANSSHTTYSGGVDFTQELFPIDYLSILYGGTLHYELLESTDIGTRDRLSCAGLMEIPIYLGSYITLLPSLRYDYFSDFSGSLNFKAGIAWKLSQSHAIKGSFAKSFRAPSFNDLYWPEESWAEGNPDLKPETGYCGDVGLTIIKDTYNINFFCFLRYMEDMILWMPGHDSVWRPVNYEKGLYPGIEIQCDVQVLNNIWAGFSYTFLYSFALTDDLEIWDDLRIPYVPVHSLDATLKYISKIHTFSLQAHYEGLKYMQQDNSTYLPPVFLLNASYILTISKYFSLYITINNLLNNMAQSMENYPLPGFSLCTGLEVVFK